MAYVPQPIVKVMHAHVCKGADDPMVSGMPVLR
jgi:hypothetical protein